MIFANTDQILLPLYLFAAFQRPVSDGIEYAIIAISTYAESSIKILPTMIANTLYSQYVLAKPKSPFESFLKKPPSMVFIVSFSRIAFLKSLSMAFIVSFSLFSLIVFLLVMKHNYYKGIFPYITIWNL